MRKLKVDYLIALPVVAVIGFYLFGGIAVLIIGLLGFLWRIAPFRNESPSWDFGGGDSGGYVGNSLVGDIFHKTGAYVPTIPPRDGSWLVLVDLVASMIVFLIGMHYFWAP